MIIADAYESMSKNGVDFKECIVQLLHQVKCLTENEKESYNMIKDEEYLSCAEPAILCNEPQNPDRALSCTIAEDLKG